MSTFTKTSKLYRDFTEIDDGAYHTLVRFYEVNEQDIISLKFEVYFEILVNYTNALFEIGAYQKHIDEVEKIIFLAIQQNIQIYQGEDIYTKSLFQKAASYYNLLEFDKAAYILKELIKINPTDQLAIRFLQKCGYQARPSYVKKGRAISIVFFLVATFLTALEVLYVKPFMPEWASIIEYLRWTVFGVGILILGGSFLYHRIRVFQNVQGVVRAIKIAKQPENKT